MKKSDFFISSQQIIANGWTLCSILWWEIQILLLRIISNFLDIFLHCWKRCILAFWQMSIVLTKICFSSKIFPKLVGLFRLNLIRKSRCRQTCTITFPPVYRPYVCRTLRKTAVSVCSTDRALHWRLGEWPVLFPGVENFPMPCTIVLLTIKICSDGFSRIQSHIVWSHDIFPCINSCFRLRSHFDIRWYSPIFLLSFWCIPRSILST